MAVGGTAQLSLGARHFNWYCDTDTSPTQFTPGTKNCPGDLIIELQFPECWDGVNLDSPNHRSHLSYPAPHVVNGVLVNCPDSHPVQIPQVSYKLAYSNATQAAGWKLSSDTMPDMTHANGTTFHGDWIGGWEPAVLQKFVSLCLVGKKDCQDGNLGDGTKLRGYGFAPGERYGSYTGPLVVAAPTRG